MNKRKSGIISIGTFCWVLIIAAVAVMSAVLLYPKIQEKNRRTTELERKRALLNRKKTERNYYMEEVDALNNDKHAVEDVAKEKYNLYPPGEKVVHFK